MVHFHDIGFTEVLNRKPRGSMQDIRSADSLPL